MNELELISAGMKLGEALANIKWLGLLLVGLCVFYAILFFWVANEKRALMKFIREKKLTQAWADFKATGGAGAVLKGEVE